ncbi:MAG: T9SS C-terminal target domain-containing protein [Phaeodactylibacter sp.]|nr:T9SS C-terminal target domain-containing protein [Phaeodactylibacter sp.]MCB9274051.1 T9SS C-terminal target domain-containing protein [Lewinellaceae bacterium]
MNRLLHFVFFLASFSGALSAQPAFRLHLEPYSIEGFTGIQSFASGQDGPYILLLGGRTDGLHLRMPFASFAAEGNNTAIQVIQPETGQHWAASASTLPDALYEQVQSTNMEFYQEGNYLYLTGGYGYSPTLGDHTTFEYLTAVDVPGLINAIIDGNSITPYFRQASDERMAVTGGYLLKTGDTFYLVGGQRFEGRYNPHNGPSFVQDYTNQIRKFRIADDGQALSITDYEAITDEANLHRRDYNVLPQVFPDGTVGMTAFSGVFQHDVDLPFLNSVDITPSGHFVNNDFLQYLNHYHCGTAALYDAQNNAMHSVFFGGISQFYLDAGGNLVEDANVPFVTTIGLVSRWSDGSMQEAKIGDMPALLGASSEFIPHPSVPLSHPGIIDMNALVDSTLAGYLIGGIESTAANIFFTNTGEESWARPSIFRVYYIPEATSSYREVRAPHLLQGLALSPNPSSGTLKIDFELLNELSVTILAQDSSGHIVFERQLGKLPAGPQVEVLSLPALPAGLYTLTLRAGRELLSASFVLD